MPQVDLHEGDWGDHGSIKVWTRVLEGKVETYKEKITIDEENKAVHLKALEVDVFEFYESYNIIFQFIPKGETNVVKTTLEYGKQNEDLPPPDKYMNFFLVNRLVKDVDAKLVQGQ
ncbi:hypothetical protein Acr_11g0006890 [Actinidia rufa]|uniref:Bet v I/Major latex protein domain-containing protein n=1 Tax=Actinidia rufa TaxID=165716 RepID=A0A7J0FCP7_9ERIC|nr:hypothetical protein Acr_11g0006890 [Actinidia rufa]